VYPQRMYMAAMHSLGSLASLHAVCSACMVLLVFSHPLLVIPMILSTHLVTLLSLIIIHAFCNFSFMDAHGKTKRAVLILCNNLRHVLLRRITFTRCVIHLSVQVLLQGLDAGRPRLMADVRRLVSEAERLTVSQASLMCIVCVLN